VVPDGERISHLIQYFDDEDEEPILKKLHPKRILKENWGVLIFLGVSALICILGAVRNTFLRKTNTEATKILGRQ
jgi:hypothetical protein